MTKQEHDLLRERAAVRIESIKRDIQRLEDLLGNAECIHSRMWFEKLDAAQMRIADSLTWAMKDAVNKTRAGITRGANGWLYDRKG